MAHDHYTNICLRVKVSHILTMIRIRHPLWPAVLTEASQPDPLGKGCDGESKRFRAITVLALMTHPCARVLAGA